MDQGGRGGQGELVCNQVKTMQCISVGRPTTSREHARVTCVAIVGNDGCNRREIDGSAPMKGREVSHNGKLRHAASGCSRLTTRASLPATQPAPVADAAGCARSAQASKQLHAGCSHHCEQGDDGDDIQLGDHLVLARLAGHGVPGQHGLQQVCVNSKGRCESGGGAARTDEEIWAL